MTETQDYKCVNCGDAAVELYREYGPTVLKLSKCVSCKCLFKGFRLFIQKSIDKYRTSSKT